MSSTPSEWLERVASVHRQRATPEQLEAMRARADAARHSSVTAKKARRMRTSLQLSSSAFTSGVGFASSDATPERSMAARSAMRSLASPDFLSPVRCAHALAQASSIEEDEADEAELEAQLTITAQQLTSGAGAILDAQSVQGALADPSSAAALAEQTRQLELALNQLEVEPEDDQARAAKFELYEGFAKLTEDARAATLELWASAQANFDAAPTVKAQIARDIAQIDRTDNLGIDFDHLRVWFVHSMCRASARNQRAIDGILGGITTKLELLSSATECPICFEAFGPDRPASTLSCAHKCCTECWAHWSELAGAGARAAACPLCRHEEFLDRVLTAATTDSAAV